MRARASASGPRVDSACRQHQGPVTCLQVLCLRNGSRHAAPTDRASLRLLHSARQRRTQGACSCLCLWHSDAATTHLAKCFTFATEAAMQLGLIGQACGCCTGRGGGRLKVRARVSASGPRVLRLGSLQVPWLSDEGTMRLRLIEQACGWSMVRGGGGRKVCSRPPCLARLPNIMHYSVQHIAGASSQRQALSIRVPVAETSTHLESVRG